MKKMISILLVLALLSGLAILPSYGLTQKPVIHLTFDGNLNDSSGNGYNGSLNPAVTFESGPVGQAARFDGAEITLAGSGAIQWENGFSLSMWLKPDMDRISGAILNMKSIDPDWDFYTTVGLNNQNESIDVAFLQQVTWDLNANAEVGYGFATEWPETGYKHVVMVYDGLVFTAYEDGQHSTTLETDTEFTTGKFVGSGLDITIGGNGGNSSYHGLIDDLQLFDSVLTYADVTALYALASTSTTTASPGASSSPAATDIPAATAAPSSTPTPAATAAPGSEAVLQALPTTSRVIVDGTIVAFESYNIGGNNFFKLRDLAMALKGSAKPFEVTWNDDRNAIELLSGQPYTSVGGELAKGDGLVKKPVTNAAKIYLDGVEIALTAYNINGYNFFKLRDIGRTFNFNVVWMAEVNTIGIDTANAYQEP